MGVQVKNFFWHKTKHNDLLIDQGFMNLSDSATGVYFRLRLLAANTNNNGSIAIGSERMNLEMLTQFIVDVFKRSRRDAAKIIEELKASKHLKVMPSGRVILPKYLLEQELPPSPAAERQRRHRDKERQGSGFDHDSSSSFPPDPSPPSTDDNDFDRDTTGDDDDSDLSRRRVTGHTQVTQRESREVRDRFKSRSRLSSPPGTTSTSTGGEGSGGKPSFPCSPEVLRDLDIYGSDPISMIKTMSGEHSKLSTGGFEKLLRRVGDGVFRTALCEVKDAMFAGHGDRPGRLIHVVANRIWGELHNDSKS